MDESLAELVRRAQRGDAEAFALLIRRYERTALAVAYSLLSDPHGAGDVVQDSFLRAWQRLRDLREPGKFGVWLCGIVRNRAIDFRRRGPRETADLTAESAARDARSQDPSAAIRQQELRGTLDAALAALDEVSRLAVVLRYYEDLSSKQIGQMLDLSPAAVDMRLMRARQELKRTLGSIDAAMHGEDEKADE